MSRTRTRVTDEPEPVESAGHLVQVGLWEVIEDGWRIVDFLSTLLGSGTLATERRLAGLPVFVSQSMTAGKLLVLDKSAVLVAAGQVMLAVSDQVWFSQDSIAIRATLRFGQALVNTARVVSLTVAGA